MIRATINRLTSVALQRRLGFWAGGGGGVLVSSGGASFPFRFVGVFSWVGCVYMYHTAASGIRRIVYKEGDARCGVFFVFSLLCRHSLYRKIRLFILISTM